MTTIKRTTVPTKVPGIPKPPAEISAGLRRYLENLSEAVEIRLGRRGDQRDRAITVRELIDSGLAVELIQRPFDPNAGGSTFVSSQPAVDTTILAAPTNFTATGAFSTIILFWDKSPYRNYSFTEIWRHDADIIGDAQLVAISSGISFVDPVGGGAAYYYWARHVSTAGIEGPFHGVNGEFAETAPDVGFLLNTLTGSITESQLYTDLGDRIDLIDGAASLEGSVAYLLAQEAAARSQEILETSQALESLIASFTLAQDYDNTVTYDVGDLAVYGGNLYRAIATTTGNLPTNTTYWEFLGEYSSLVEMVGGNLAAIVQLNNVSASSTSANASALFGLQSTVNNSETGLPATRATLFNDYYTSADTDTAISSATTGLVSSTQLNTALGDYTTTASLTTNYYTQTATDSAISSATTGLASTTYVTNALGDYTTTASLTTNYYTQTATDSAISSAVSTLASTVGGNTAALQLAAQSIDGLEAQYTVKIDNNGYVTGYGLASTLVDDVPFSEFIVRADRFAIASVGQTEVVPFVVTTATTTLNGETVPAGVYIDQAYIKNGAISEAKIGTLSADKITSGFISASRLSAGIINAEKLAISANVDGSANSIYMDSAGAIKVYDASGNLRVKLGNLSV